MLTLIFLCLLLELWRILIFSVIDYFFNSGKQQQSPPALVNISMNGESFRNKNNRDGEGDKNSAAHVEFLIPDSVELEPGESIHVPGRVSFTFKNSSILFERAECNIRARVTNTGTEKMAIVEFSKRRHVQFSSAIVFSAQNDS